MLHLDLGIIYYFCAIVYTKNYGLENTALYNKIYSDSHLYAQIDAEVIDAKMVPVTMKNECLY